LFLEKFKLEELVEKDVNVDTEYYIEENRRIDIYITFNKTEYIIAIENKIWAKDQKDQLEYYNQHLVKKLEEREYILFYLNPYGLSPSEASIDQKAFEDLKKSGNIKIIDYQEDIINLVQEWINICEADRIRFILKDFKQYLNQEIKGINIMKNNSETVANYIIDDNKVESAFEVINAINEVKKKLIPALKQQIKEIEKEINEIEKCDFEGNLGFEEETYFIFYIKDSKKKYSISFGFHDYFNKFIYGICCDNRLNNEFREDIAKKLNNKGLIKFSNWVWVDKFEEYYNWNNNAKPWLAITDGSMKENILEKVKKLISVLDDLDI